MKLRYSKLTRAKLRSKRPAVVFVGGLIMAGLVLTALVASPHNGLFAGSAPAFAASLPWQDEVRIQLSANGFTPTDVQHAAGTFAITVENSAISGEYTLRVKASDGTVVKEVQVQKGSAAWTMSLSAGEYTLTEASHPQWSCRISVQ